MNHSSHFLRVARTLAFVSGASLMGCGVTVAPGDSGADGTGADTSVMADSSLMCPVAIPTMGSMCPAIGQACTYEMPSSGVQTYCVCRTSGADTNPAWSCSTAVEGPLPPPELAAWS
ncbi:MAG: hypothetical protein Q8Q09_24675 [Deltaproteobacteria bacterium]|nr:hypothetical protein [Deltaproteobacteria bacterium]